jgi:GT2 family glycosyltransferase
LQDFPRVSIVVLNWNGWKDTIECLESLWKINYPFFDIVVVDNHSDDESIKEIREYIVSKLGSGLNYGQKHYFKLKEYSETELLMKNSQEKSNQINFTDREIVILKSLKNTGFAGGNNLGIVYALKFLDPDYLLLLNNDTLVEKDFLEKMLEMGESYKDIGVIGPKTCYYPQKNLINSAGADMVWHLGLALNRGIGDVDQGQYDEPMEVDSLLGACLLIKKDLIEKIGLLDSRFFLILEETDFCLRAQKAGYKVVYDPESKIYHKEGFSGSMSPLGMYYLYRNRLIIMKKHLKSPESKIYPYYIFLRAMADFVIYKFQGESDLSEAVINGYNAGRKYLRS